MNARKTKQPAAGSGRIFTEDDYAYIGRMMAEAYEHRLKRRGATAPYLENATHERGNAFAAAPCYAPLRWSAEKPKRAGWWWWRKDATAAVFIADVRIWPHYAEPNAVLYHATCMPQMVTLSEVGGLWSGPLEPPESPIVEPEHNASISDRDPKAS